MVQKKLQVLFINSWYPSRVLPTNGDFIQRHAECVALYHEVTALHVITDPEQVEKKIMVEDFTENNVRTLIAYLPKTKNPFKKWYRFLKSFVKLLKKVNGFDIIHLNHIYPAGLFTFVLAIFKSKKYIISEHWTFYHEEFQYLIKPFERFISKLVARQADFICPVSDELASSMQSFGLKSKYHKVPNVVDTELFKPGKTTSGRLELLHVSNMNELQKNISGMLSTMKKLQDAGINFHLNMIGSNASTFAGKVKSLGLRDEHITLIDQMPHNDLIAYFQNADAFILFSDDENLPCVILESFACGTPVISTDVGGIAEYFPSKFGRLIPRGDEEALFDAIIDLQTREDLASRDEMHEYAHLHFGPESIATQFSKVYYMALGKKN